ncbi:MAG TPA: polysaccharide biosynthesis tyrosine autokinase [Methylibium sp.]|nr:polysaccharide biosynthesis tyrosine autokinase [Methylibium sp.]
MSGDVTSALRTEPGYGWEGQRLTDADTRPLGEHLVELGALRPTDVDGVRQWQAKSGLRFGEAAVQLGLVSQAAVKDALAQQYHYPQLLDPLEKLSPELVMAMQPDHPLAEQLRTLRTQIVLRWRADGRPGQSLAVVSSERGDGRSFVAANLAIALAQMNLRTLLVDLDLRHPRQHELFGASDRIGVSSMLVGRALAGEVQAVQTTTLSVMTCGPRPPNPQELLAPATLQPVLDMLRRRFDVIVLDTTAWNDSADAQLIAAQADSTLVVVRPDHSALPATRRMADALRQAGARPVGAVLNRR